MYKETLDILMEDINDHNNIKETILKNQLQYHFTNKNRENKNVLDNATVIVRRILSRFPLSQIIGIQPVVDKDNPTIISQGNTYDIDVATRPLQTAYPGIPLKDLETMNGIDLESEIDQAIAAEFEFELVNEFLQLISRHATEVRIDAIEDIKGIDTIMAAVVTAIEDTDANWIVANPLILAILQCSELFIADSDGHGTMGELLYVGTLALDDNVKVYSTLWGGEDVVLVGRKDFGEEDTPIVYAPDVMLMAGKASEEQNILMRDQMAEFTPLMTRYGHFTHIPAAMEQYRKISINIKDNG